VPDPSRIDHKASAALIPVFDRITKVRGLSRSVGNLPQDRYAAAAFSEVATNLEKRASDRVHGVGDEPADALNAESITLLRAASIVFGKRPLFP